MFSPDSSRVLTLHHTTTNSASDTSGGSRAVLWDIRAERDAVAPSICIAVPAADMRNNLLALLRSGEDADVTLRTADGTEFKAHRAILRMRSTHWPRSSRGATARLTSRLCARTCPRPFLHGCSSSFTPTP